MRTYTYTETSTSISEAQRQALAFVTSWASEQKTPCPKKELFKYLINADVSESTSRKAIESLVKKGYIRRAITPTKQSYFVLLKWL